MAALLGATPDEVTFLQNTSEGINVVANMLDWRPGDNVVLNDLEYFPNAYPWLNLAVRGVESRVVRLRDSSNTPADLAEMIDPRTRMVAVSRVGLDQRSAARPGGDQRRIPRLGCLPLRRRNPVPGGRPGQRSSG